MPTKEIEEEKKFQISESVLRATKYCSNDHLCLKTTSEQLCEIELYFEGVEQIYKCKYKGFCNYKLTCFNVDGGCDTLCNCPTRIELYKKYNI